MTEQKLRELLDDLVTTDEPKVDPAAAGRAWRAARRTRRTYAVVGAATACVALVVGVAAVTRDWSPENAQPPVSTPTLPTSTPSATPKGPPNLLPVRPPDTHYAGAPVWWAPSAKQDKRLPWLDTVLPRSIDLSAGLAPFEPGERALAVFGVWDAETAEYQRFVVLTPAGETRLLAAPHIEDNRDESGNGAALFPGNGGLSPDGWHLAFAQTSSIELYDLATGNWTTIDTPDWVAEGARWLDAETLLVPGMGSSGSTFGVDGLPVERPGTWDQQAIMLKDKDQPYGPRVDAPDRGAQELDAQAAFLAGPIAGGPYSNPEGIIARVGGEYSVLAVSVDGRGKGCCSLVGWLDGWSDSEVIAFETNRRVLAWRVGTQMLYRVTEFTGFAPDKEFVGSSWAWQTLR